MKNKALPLQKIMCACFLFLLCLSVWIPLFLMLTGSVTGSGEWSHILLPMKEQQGAISFPIVPAYPTLQPWIELLLDTPAFFNMFWNSCKLVLPIVGGQVLVGAPMAWALTQFRFPGQKLLYYIYIVLMLLPFQVTMVSNYLILDALSLVGTRWSVILPGIFSPFAVFIMTKGFEGIPKSLLEAAEIDGAGAMRCFVSIGLPLGFPTILSAIILGFLEYWAMIEQPLIFLKDESIWPVSLFTPSLTAETAGVNFVAAILILLPGVLMFLFGQNELEQGIAATGSVDSIN